MHQGHTKRKQVMAGSSRKTKKTFSLSQDAVHYLDTLRKQLKKPSASAVLDEILRDRIAEARLQQTAIAIRRYYDSLSDDEVVADKRWGEFAENQLPSKLFPMDGKRVPRLGENWYVRLPHDSSKKTHPTVVTAS